MKQNMKAEPRLLFVAGALFIALFIGGCGGSNGPVGGGYGNVFPSQPPTTSGTGTTTTKQATANPQPLSEVRSDK